MNASLETEWMLKFDDLEILNGTMASILSRDIKQGKMCGMLVIQG